ncbi:MAG: signal transduction histidine kinase, partial [Saprospiraceae bacterium]
MKKPVIIYVDDEKIVLDSIKAQLKRNFDRDIEFESAESAEEALELLDELTKEGITVPLVISDHIMPNMKGDEFLTKVYEKFPEIKTILLTGQADANAVGNAVNNAHLYRYISKPWVEKDLQLTIRAAVKSFDDENQLTSLYNKLNALSGALSGDFSDSYKALNVEGTIEGDLDVLKNAIVTLVNAKESAEISAAAKAQFLATMSHELRTPLNAIIAISNLLKDGKPKSDQVENIEALNFSSKILLSLINDILDFSKIEAGKMSFEDVDINLNNFTKNIIRIHQRVTTEKGIGLNLIIEDNLPFVTADSTILEQIINNLLSNAIKFTAEGAVEFTVKKGKETEEYCTFYFQVKDSGIG